MDDIYVYLISMPEDIDEYVVPCIGGYTVYLSAQLDDAHRIRAYRHALRHILNNDFEKYNANTVEYEHMEVST